MFLKPPGMNEDFQQKALKTSDLYNENKNSVNEYHQMPNLATVVSDIKNST